jgi:predicted RNA-binding protein
MLRDNNRRINELLEDFDLQTYDLVSTPSIDFTSLLNDNSKVLDEILNELKRELRNEKIQVLIDEQRKTKTSKRNRRRNR